MPRSNQLLLKYLNNIVLNGNYPVEPARVAGLSLSFKYDPNFMLSSFDSEEVAEQLSTVIFPVEKFSSLASIFLAPIASAYLDFNKELSDELFELFDTYCASDESRMAWKIYRVAPQNSIITSTGLNSFQKSWMLFHSHKDQMENIELISNALTALQPWLNLDLYRRIQEQKYDDEAPRLRENSLIDAYEFSAEGMYEAAMQKRLEAANG